MEARVKSGGRVALVRPFLKKATTREEQEPYLDESTRLVEALGLSVSDALLAPLGAVRSSTYVSQGFVDSVQALLNNEKPEFVVVDCTLSPIQQRNLEKIWDVKVLDRTELILRIFSERAESAEGALQVELAALNYQKSRLVRTWTHLERQTGGYGFMAGPGESQLEVDRRLIGRRIDVLRKKLDQVAKTRSLQRRARTQAHLPTVALVGYTNAGKSTLFNALTQSQVMAADLLFATLDPRMRVLKLPSGRRIILSDTVGFISDLPPQLVAAFKATLEEVVHADLILHVHDASSALRDQQSQVVRSILDDIGVTLTDGKTPCLHILNKIDKVQPIPEGRDALAFSDVLDDEACFSVVSAVQDTSFDDVLLKIDAALSSGRRLYKLSVPDDYGALASWLFERGCLERFTTEEDTRCFHVWLTAEEYGTLRAKFHDRFSHLVAVDESIENPFECDTTRKKVDR